MNNSAIIHDLLIHFLRHGGDIISHEQYHDGMTVQEALSDEDFKYPNHDSYPNFSVSQTENYRRDDISYTLNGGSCSSPRGISYNEYGGTLHFVKGDERPTLNIPMVFELMEKIADKYANDFDMKLAGRINYTIEVWHSASLMKDGMTLGGHAADSKRSAIATYGADALHSTTKTIIVRFLDNEGKTSCACNNGEVEVQLYQFRNRRYKVTCPVCNGSGRRVPEAITMRTVDDAVQRQSNRNHSNVPDMIDYRLDKEMADYAMMAQPTDINYQPPNIKQVMDDYREYIAQHAPLLCACGSCITNGQALFPNYANKTYGCIECADKKPAVLKELSQ